MLFSQFTGCSLQKRDCSQLKIWCVLRTTERWSKKVGRFSSDYRTRIECSGLSVRINDKRVAGSTIARMTVNTFSERKELKN